MLFPNPFVYQRTLEADIKSATIPSMLEQHYGQCGEDLIIGSVLKSMLHCCSFPRQRKREQIAEFLPNTACYQP